MRDYFGAKEEKSTLVADNIKGVFPGSFSKGLGLGTVRRLRRKRDDSRISVAQRKQWPFSARGERGVSLVSAPKGYDGAQEYLTELPVKRENTQKTERKESGGDS